MATPWIAADEDVYRAVLGGPQFAAALDDLAARTGRTKPDLHRDAEAALAEMAAEITPSAMKLWDRMGKSLTRSYVVDADTSTLADLRARNRDHSLVFLPNHRSYLDPLVLRSVLAKHGFPPNFTLGGINLAKWPISELGKRSGLIFIRRSTKDDPTYPVVLRLYLGHLLRQHANLEWYFEGGRTRTGKLRPPKMGVLRYLVDAFVAADATDGVPDGPADDVFLVPVAIVYD
ncbi:MAG: 1-acyl-sn-glycerol-3-phosphate acyltransferase, partial [Nocardioides sp.]